MTETPDSAQGAESTPRKAWQLIETYGFRSDRVGDYDIGFCPIGAILEAYGIETDMRIEKLELLRNRIQGSGSIVQWARNQTRETAVALMRELGI
jgi:hypothetical protein